MIHQAPGLPGRSPGTGMLFPVHRFVVSPAESFLSCNAPMNPAGAGNMGGKAACRVSGQPCISYSGDVSVRPETDGKSRNDGGKDD
jgi:hypothetical protein